MASRYISTLPSRVERLQQALIRCEAGRLPSGQPIPELLSFDLAGCAAELTLLEEYDADVLPPREEQKTTGILDWRWTSKDPFAGQWEQILTWGQANPTRSCGDILRELQSLFPGRYEDSHLRTLQRGMRKIRTSLLHISGEKSSTEERQENPLSSLDLESARSTRESLETPSFAVDEKRPLPDSSDQYPTGEDRSSRVERTQKHVLPFSKPVPDQVVRRAHTASSRLVHCPSSQKKSQRLTLEGAIQQYLQAHRMVGHCPKTLEWHQTVLAHLHQYLQTDGHLVLVYHLTETALRNWLEWLSQTPTAKGALRSASTIETYARSARALCGWLVQQRGLSCSPLSERLFPRTDVPLPHIVSPALFEQLMRTGFPHKRKREVQCHL